jgi:hypothetical protein
MYSQEILKPSTKSKSECRPNSNPSFGNKLQHLHAKVDDVWTSLVGPYEILLSNGYFVLIVQSHFVAMSS